MNVIKKSDLIQLFLESKGIKNIDDCTKRQKQILNNETPNMWLNYQWNLSSNDNAKE